jgi:hypothetical protein
LFLKNNGVMNYPHLIHSFHTCRTSRELEERGANPGTIGPEKYNGGERDYNSDSTNNNT